MPCLDIGNIFDIWYRNTDGFRDSLVANLTQYEMLTETDRLIGGINSSLIEESELHNKAFVC